MLNQAIKLSSILFLFAALLFTSCAKDDSFSESFSSDKTDIFGDKDWDKDGDKNGEYHRNRCFEVLFPISVTMPDGTIVTGEDKESLRDQIKDWYVNNPNVEEKPSLVFPIEVEMKEDGSIVTVDSMEDMAALKEDCRGEYEGGHGERCLTVIYPVTINFPDGTSTTVEDRGAFKAAILTWKENNPDAAERPSLAYPVDVKLEDGTIVTVNSTEEMAALKEDCRGEYEENEHQERCFKLEFPLTMNMPDGTTITGEDRESLKDQIKDWYINNPGVEEKPSLVFPLNVIMSEDDSVVTLNSLEELVALKEACED